MLKPSGVIAICIDDNELYHLGMLMDEVFGEDNRLGIINWQKTYSPKTTKHISTATEYVLVYAKDEDLAKTGLLPRDEGMNARRPGRLLDLGAACTGAAVGDVVFDRVVEQDRVLRHDADRLAHAGLRHLADVLAGDTDRAVLHVIEAIEQPRQRRLARA